MSIRLNVVIPGPRLLILLVIILQSGHYIEYTVKSDGTSALQMMLVPVLGHPGS